MGGRVALIVITDPRYDDDRIVEVARAVCEPRVAIQLRDRSTRTDDELFPLASRLRELTTKTGATLIVNRRLELARRISADGFHAPGSDLPREFAWRSAPVHDDLELQTARIAGATAALLSPIFRAPGKSAPIGLGALRAARAREPDLAIYALGGVDETNARSCHEAGADGVALIRAIFEATDAARVAKCVLSTS